MTNQPKQLDKAVDNNRTLQGVVVRKSGDKTVSVAVSRMVAHPLYLKRAQVVKKYLVHDPSNEAKVGETVTIRHTRPLSHSKRWMIVK